MALTPIIKQLMFRTSIVFLVKLVGAVVRIPLFRWLGAEGVGLYQLVYSLYGLILTLVTGGFPITITLFTAKDQQLGLRMLKAAILLLALIGVIIGLIFHAFAPSLAKFLGDNRLEWPIKFIGPAVVLVPLLSLIRGYMQGLELYSSIAISELVEQVFRVLTITLLVSFWIKHGVGLAVSGAVFGAVVGAWMALCFLLIMLRSTWKKVELSNSLLHWDENKLTFFTFIELIRVSMAITASRWIVPLADFLDALIIPHRLHHTGLTSEAATALYGIFTGMAASIVYIPTLVSSAVSHIYAAKITVDWIRGDYTRFQRRAIIILQHGWLWGLACSLYFYYYHDPLSKIFFGSLIASQAILYLCLAPLISGMRELSNTILWAADRKKEPMFGLLLGIIAASVLGYFLVGLASFSLKGIAIELLALESVAAYWNLRILKRMDSQFIQFKQLLFEASIVFIVAWITQELGKLFTARLYWPNNQSVYIEMFFSFICVFGYVFFRSRFTSKTKLFIS